MDPFQSIQVTSRNNLIKLLEIILLLIKLPLFLAIITEIIVVNDLILGQIQKLEMRTKFHKILRIIILLHNYFVGRLLLLTLGYFKYKSLFSFSNHDYKFNNLQSFSFYCTRTSPVDVLFYITYFSPSFTECSLQNKEFKLRIISYYQAISDSFFIERCGFKQFDDGSTIMNLMDQIIKNRTGPLIIFYEGGITNGCSFLKIDQVIYREMKQIMTSTNQQQYQRKEFNLTNPQAFLSIIHDDEMNLIGNGPIKMLFNLLTNSFSNIDMFFMRIPTYYDTTLPEQKYYEKYKEFIEQKLQRGISDQSWKEFRKYFVRQNN